MLTLPFSTDQFDGAAAVETAGFGLAANPNDLNPALVARAIEHLLGSANPELAALKDDLRARPGPQIARSAAAEWLYPAQAVAVD